MMKHFYEAPRAVKSRETGNRMGVGMPGVEVGSAVVNGDRVSVWEGEGVLEVVLAHSGRVLSAAELNT